MRGERFILKTKSADILILLIIIGAAVFYANSAFDFKQSPGTMGAGYFPLILSAVLIILCLISIFKIVKNSDNIKINLSNIRIILLTTVLVGGFIYSWSMLGMFYVNTLILIFLLITIYKQIYKIIPLIINFALSIVFTIFIYLIFGLILNLNL